MPRREPFVPDVPGPGTYKHEMKWIHPNRARTLGKRCHPKPKTADVPGPGKYAPKVSAFGDAPKYTLGRRTKKSHHTWNTDGGAPGPGHYNIVGRSSLSKRGVSISGKWRQRRITQDAPGPKYNPTQAAAKVSKRKRAPAFSMGKKPSVTLVGNPSNVDIPGPGAYRPENAKNAFGGKTTRKYPLGTKWRGHGQAGKLLGGGDFNTTPGPGSYKPKSYVGGGPKVTFGRKWRTRSKLDDPGLEVPGPGTYTQHHHDLAVTSKGKGVRIRERARRSKHTASASPGPGKYDTSKSTLSHMSVSIRGKLHDKRGFHYTIPDTPGPGQYRATQAYLKTKPTTTPISIKGKRREKRMVDSGPGLKYNSNNMKCPPSGPSIGFKGKHENPIKVSSVGVPGPGQYDVVGAMHAVKKHGAVGVSIRTRKARAKIVSDAPGPGKYTPKPPSPVTGGGRSFGRLGFSTTYLNSSNAGILHLRDV